MLRILSTTSRAQRAIEAIDFGELGALRDGRFLSDRSYENFSRTVTSNKQQVDELFRQPTSRSWTTVTSALSLHLPQSVTEIVARARLAEVKIQPVLSLGSISNMPLSMLRVVVPQAVVIGLGWSLGLPTVAMLALQGAAFALYAMPKLDPILYALHRYTGIPYEPRAHGEVGIDNRSLIVNAPLWLTNGIDPETVAHEMLHVVDYSCGGPEGLAAEPEFVALYEAIVSGNAAAPDPYALHSTRELFTTGALAFLGLSKTMTSKKLREVNESLWSYFQHLFAERLPSAIASGTVRPSSEWTQDQQAALRLMHPLYREPLGLLLAYKALGEADNLEAQLDGKTREALQSLRDRTSAYLSTKVRVPKTRAFASFGSIKANLRRALAIADDLLAANPTPR